MGAKQALGGESREEEEARKKAAEVYKNTLLLGEYWVKQATPKKEKTEEAAR